MRVRLRESTAAIAQGVVVGRGPRGLLVEMDDDGYLMEASDGEWEIVEVGNAE
jgi:hypothetical protein